MQPGLDVTTIATECCQYAAEGGVVNEDEAGQLQAYARVLDEMLRETIKRAELNLLSYLIAMAAEVAVEEAVRRRPPKTQGVG
jgi:hypothetical protein